MDAESVQQSLLRGGVGGRQPSSVSDAVWFRFLQSTLTASSSSPSSSSTTTTTSSSLSSAQDTALVVLPKVAATLSLLASAWLVLEVWVYSRNKSYYVYHKLVAGMAMYSFLGSLWYFVGHWAATHSPGNNAAACRTQGFLLQVSMLGTAVYFSMLFLYYLLVISCSYSEDQLTMTLRAWGGNGSNNNGNHNTNSGSLKFLSWLCSFDWERSFHLFPILLSLTTATASLPLDLLYPIFGTVVASTGSGDGIFIKSSWCWIAAPVESPSSLGEENRIGAFQWSFYLGPAAICFAIMIGALIIVFRGVAAQEQRMKKYVTSHKPKDTKTTDGINANSVPVPPVTRLSSIEHQDLSNSKTQNHSESEIHAVSSHSQPQYRDYTMTLNDSKRDDTEHSGNAVFSRFASSVSAAGRCWKGTTQLVSFAFCCPSFKEYWEHRPRSRQVVVQALCYVAAFFWCNIFLLINQGLTWTRSGRVPYALLILQVIYQPLQGLFIFLAYRRPTYMRMRRKGQCRFEALKTTLQWNAHPVEKPRQRNRVSLPSVRSPSLRERRKERKRLKRELQKKLQEEKQRLAEEREQRRRIKRAEAKRKKRAKEIEKARLQKQQQKLQQRRASEPNLSSNAISMHGSGASLVGANTRPHRRRSFFMQVLGKGADEVQAGSETNRDLGRGTSSRSGMAGNTSTRHFFNLDDAFQRSASAPVAMSLQAENLDGSLEFEDLESIQSPTDLTATDPLHGPATASGAAKNALAAAPRDDSLSTLGTRRTSEMTKEGSSKQFKAILQKDESMRLRDLVRRFSEDEISFTLEQMMGIVEEDGVDFSYDDNDDDDDDDNDDDDDDLETTNREEESEVESLQDSGKRRFQFIFFGGRREPRENFRMVKEQSERYMDLCAMDIIPEADGVIEEKWRTIVSRSTRYKKTKLDRQKLHMSVPVMSDRNMESFTRPPPPARTFSSEDNRRRRGENHHNSFGKNRSRQQAPSESPRFAWSKLNANPLFKMSGRRRVDSPAANRRKPPPSPNTSSSSFGRSKRTAAAASPAAAISRVDSGNSKGGRGVSRTSSGGYFVGSAEKDGPDDKFLAKLELEKKRKDMLNAISSRRFASDRYNVKDNSDEATTSDRLGEETKTAIEATSIDAQKILEEARRDLERSIVMRDNKEALMVENELQLEMEDVEIEMGSTDAQEDRFNSGGEGDRPPMVKSSSGSGRWLQRATQDLRNTVNLFSNRSLDHIPEVSEHSQSSDNHTKSDQKKLSSDGLSGSQRRISSGELSNKRSSTSSEMVAESSNEMTVRSERTIKRSNKAQMRSSDASSAGQSSHLSEDVSVVSDNPMSDDGFLSDSSADSTLHDNGVDDEDYDGHSGNQNSLKEDGESSRNNTRSKKRRSSGSKLSEGLPQQKEVRSSLRDLQTMQRLSERSMEDIFGESSGSIHIDTSDMLKIAHEKEDESEHTEHA